MDSARVYRAKRLEFDLWQIQEIFTLVALLQRSGKPPRIFIAKKTFQNCRSEPVKL